MSHAAAGAARELGVGIPTAGEVVDFARGLRRRATWWLEGIRVNTSRVLAAADQIQELPVGAGRRDIERVMPEAVRAVSEAGIVVDGFSVGRGMWEEEAALGSEKDFHIVGRGPREAFEVLGARLGQVGRAHGIDEATGARIDYPDQGEVLIAHMVPRGDTPTTTISFGRGQRDIDRALTRAMTLLRGWHTGYTKWGDVSHLFVAGRQVDGTIADRVEFEARMNLVRETLEQEGARVGGQRYEFADVVSYRRGEYREVIRRAEG